MSQPNFDSDWELEMGSQEQEVEEASIARDQASAPAATAASGSSALPMSALPSGAGNAGDPTALAMTSPPPALPPSPFAQLQAPAPPAASPPARRTWLPFGGRAAPAASGATPSHDSLGASGSAAASPFAANPFAALPASASGAIPGNAVAASDPAVAGTAPTPDGENERSADSVAAEAVTVGNGVSAGASESAAGDADSASCGGDATNRDTTPPPAPPSAPAPAPPPPAPPLLFSLARRPPADHIRILSGIDGPALLRPMVPRRPSPLHFKILVAGGSALGKSTFIHNTAIRFGAPLHMVGAPRPGGLPLSSFAADPGSHAAVLPDIPLPGTGRTLKATFQDTPGTGRERDLLGHLRCVLRWLLAQRERDFAHAAGASRLAADSLGALPHAATVCLFFIQPHSLLPCELEYLHALSQLVAVVPVLAKADCHTEEELEAHRAEVARAMEGRRDAEGRPAPVEPFRFSPSALDSLHLPPGPPDLPAARRTVFSVLASRTMDELRLDGGRRMWVPVREYGWGSVSGADRGASDTLPLQRLLTEDVWALQTDARDRYLSFCARYEAAGRDTEAMLEALLRPYEAALAPGDGPTGRWGREEGAADAEAAATQPPMRQTVAATPATTVKTAACFHVFNDDAGFIAVAPLVKAPAAATAAAPGGTANPVRAVSANPTDYQIDYRDTREPSYHDEAAAASAPCAAADAAALNPAWQGQVSGSPMGNNGDAAAAMAAAAGSPTGAAPPLGRLSDEYGSLAAVCGMYEPPAALELPRADEPYSDAAGVAAALPLIEEKEDADAVAAEVEAQAEAAGLGQYLDHYYREAAPPPLLQTATPEAAVRHPPASHGRGFKSRVFEVPGKPPKAL